MNGQRAYIYFLPTKNFNLAQEIIDLIDAFEKIEAPEIKKEILDAFDNLSKSKELVRK